MPCRILNVSNMGALLDFPGDATQIPDRFKLSIPGEMFESICTVRHRTADKIGVLFTTNRREALSRFSSPYQGMELERY